MNQLIPYLDKGLQPSHPQLQLAERLMHFLQSPTRVMVVDGYAGTGKTTLIAALVKYLQDNKQPVVLLASTGRAAKILAEKARFPAETIHRHLYILQVTEVDSIKKTKRLVFKIRPNFAPENTIYVVDESSMISDHAGKNLFLNFGGGRLLAELLQFTASRKIIFVGDANQLPPINVAFPPVFEPQYFERKFGITPLRFRLTEQKRFKPDSSIFVLTEKLRQDIESRQKIPLRISTGQKPDIVLHSNVTNFDIELARRIRSYGIDNCVGVCYSNKNAFEHSQQVRSILFNTKQDIRPGEILIVVQNNYLFNITNGEHVEVDRLGDSTKHAGLTFRKFEGRLRDYQGYRAIAGLLIEDLLYNPLPSLTNEQETELFVDFVMRMKRKGIKEDSDEFFRHQISDPYLNALRVKFGYVITCHKAQGGEWDEVFIDIENTLLFNPPEQYLRWVYTAVSRSAKTVHFLKKSFIY